MDLFDICKEGVIVEAVYAALIAMGSAVAVTILNYSLNRHSEKKGAIAQLSGKVDNLSAKLDKHIADEQEAKAVEARHRILAADDEILHGVKHSKEWFDSLLEYDITNYQRYCAEHPDFPNAMTVSAVENIRRVYEQCKAERSFL